ncbi:helix-turn-helix domain-containing protein [Agathobaculum butyriciproducens]
MPVSYDKLRKLLIDKKMKRTELKDAAGISFNVLATKNRIANTHPIIQVM